MPLANNECTERTRSIREDLLLYMDRKRTPRMAERLRHLRSAVEKLIILVRLETGEDVEIGEPEPQHEDAGHPG